MRNRNDGIRKVCGCPPAVWTKCRHGWRMNLKWKGVHHRYALDRLLAPRKVRSKTEADAEAERIRTAIPEGTFRQAGEPDPGPVLSTLTLAQLLKTYDERYLTPERHQIAAIGSVPRPLPTGEATSFKDQIGSSRATRPQLEPGQMRTRAADSRSDDVRADFDALL
jgi:hypothetical protein